MVVTFVLGVGLLTEDLEVRVSTLLSHLKHHAHVRLNEGISVCEQESLLHSIFRVPRNLFVEQTLVERQIIMHVDRGTY